MKCLSNLRAEVTRYRFDFKMCYISLQIRYYFGQMFCSEIFLRKIWSHNEVIYNWTFNYPGPRLVTIMKCCSENETIRLEFRFLYQSTYREGKKMLLLLGIILDHRVINASLYLATWQFQKYSFSCIICHWKKQQKAMKIDFTLLSLLKMRKKARIGPVT